MIRYNLHPLTTRRIVECHPGVTRVLQVETLPCVVKDSKKVINNMTETQFKFQKATGTLKERQPFQELKITFKRPHSSSTVPKYMQDCH